jgi:hypothetical protein
VIDGGGSAFKWLFGVATQADLAGLNKKITGLTRQENESSISWTSRQRW